MASCQQYEGQIQRHEILAVKVLSKAKSDHALGVRDDRAKLVCNDPKDLTQHWLKIWTADSPAFQLVNTVTMKALCKPLAPGQEVFLVPYIVGCVDERSLWSECGNATDEFRAISEAKHTTFILEADHSGQSIKVVVQTSHCPKENQLWKLSSEIVTVSCKAKSGYALGIEDGKAQLVPNHPSAQTQVPKQHWVRVWNKANQAFQLVNTATVQALCHPDAPGQQVKLEPYIVGFFDDRSLWTERGNTNNGFRAISEANNPNLILDADQSGQKITVTFVPPTQSPKESQLWKISE